MEDESMHQLKDYKIFCFHNVPQYIQLDYDRFTNHGRNYYDTFWNFCPFSTGEYPFNKNRFSTPPIKLTQMLALASKLSQGFPFARVDFYSVQGKIYFGELTFYPGSGLEEFTPPQWDQKLGNLIKLPAEQ